MNTPLWERASARDLALEEGRGLKPPPTRP
jgi:hypothetical protein